MQLRPNGKRLAREVRRAKRTGKRHVPTAAVAVPLLSVAMPASWFAILGRLPPAWCAASAALFVVSH
jgi:hypothetical protein